MTKKWLAILTVIYAQRVSVISEAAYYQANVCLILVWNIHDASLVGPPEPMLTVWATAEPSHVVGNQSQVEAATFQHAVDNTEMHKLHLILANPHTGDRSQEP